MPTDPVLRCSHSTLVSFTSRNFVHVPSENVLQHQKLKQYAAQSMISGPLTHGGSFKMSLTWLFALSAGNIIAIPRRPGSPGWPGCPGRPGGLKSWSTVDVRIKVFTPEESVAVLPIAIMKFTSTHLNYNTAYIHVDTIDIFRNGTSHLQATRTACCHPSPGFQSHSQERSWRHCTAEPHSYTHIYTHSKNGNQYWIAVDCPACKQQMDGYEHENMKLMKANARPQQFSFFQ